MVQWPWLPVGRKKVPPRGKSKSGQERLDTEKARFLIYAKKTRPDLYEKLMSQMFGLREDRQSDIDKLIELRSKLKQFDESDAGSFAELMKVAPAILGAMFGGGMPAGARVVEQQPATPPALPQPPVAPALPEAPQPRRRRSSPHLNRRPSPKRRAAMEAAGQPEGQVPPSMTVSQLIMQGIAGKLPDDAAAWLLAQDEPLIQRFVPILVQTPEFAFMHAIGKLKQQGGWSELAVWLEQNEEWSKAVIRALKERSKQTA